MEYFNMLHRVVLIKTDVSEELCAYIIRVTRIGDDRGATFFQNVGSYKDHTA
jgi:hypothetical protein